MGGVIFLTNAMRTLVGVALYPVLLGAIGIQLIINGFKPVMMDIMKGG